MVKSLQTLCKLFIIKRCINYQSLPTSLKQHLEYLEQCRGRLFFSKLKNNSILYPFGLCVEILPREGDVTLMSGDDEEYLANFSLKQCDFSILLSNTGYKRVLVQIYNGIKSLGNFLVDPDEVFMLTAATSKGKQFRFDHTIPTVNFPNNTNSSQLVFVVKLEKEIPEGVLVCVQCIHGRRYVIDIDIECTILDLKRCLSEYVPFKINLGTRRNCEDIELSHVLLDDVEKRYVSKYITCEDHHTLRYYNLDKKMVYMAYNIHENLPNEALPTDTICRGTPTNQEFDVRHYFVECPVSIVSPFSINCVYKHGKTEIK